MAKNFEQKEKEDSKNDNMKDVSTQTNITGEHPKTSLRYEADKYIHEREEAFSQLLQSRHFRSFETDQERLMRHIIQFENSL